MSPSPKSRLTRREIGNRIRALIASWAIRPEQVGVTSYKPPVIRVTSAHAVSRQAKVAVAGSEMFFRGQVHGGKLPTKADVFAGTALYLSQHMEPVLALTLLVGGARGQSSSVEIDYYSAVRNQPSRLDAAQVIAKRDPVNFAFVEKAATMSGVPSTSLGLHVVIHNTHTEADYQRCHDFLQRLAVLVISDPFEQV